MRNRGAGFSLIELLAVVVVIAILVLILVPTLLCYLEKAKLAGYISNAVHARDVLDGYAATMGVYPAELADAYISGRPPPELLYCVDGDDPNAGHGNDCDTSDGDNPSGKPGPHAVVINGFRLWTEKGLCSGCTQIDYLWITGSGAPVVLIKIGEKEPKPPKPPKPPKGGPK